ncbi:MAG: hypothetical protein ACRDJH_07675 [Thermomicrobiales bacterium]
MGEIDPTGIPMGTSVVAADGTTLGTVHLVHEHYVLVDQPDDPHASLTVPAHAIARFEGQLYLSVNREALSVVDHDESAGHRLEGE